jgi:hypothetical protein
VIRAITAEAFSFSEAFSIREVPKSNRLSH